MDNRRGRFIKESTLIEFRYGVRHKPQFAQLHIADNHEGPGPRVPPQSPFRVHPRIDT